MERENTKGGRKEKLNKKAILLLIPLLAALLNFTATAHAQSYYLYLDNFWASNTNPLPGQQIVLYLNIRYGFPVQTNMWFDIYVHGGGRIVGPQEYWLSGYGSTTYPFYVTTPSSPGNWQLNCHGFFAMPGNPYPVQGSNRPRSVYINVQTTQPPPYTYRPPPPPPKPQTVTTTQTVTQPPVTRTQRVPFVPQWLSGLLLLFIIIAGVLFIVLAVVATTRPAAAQPAQAEQPQPAAPAPAPATAPTPPAPTTPPPQRYCQRCGTERRPPTANFCTRCGQSFP